MLFLDSIGEAALDILEQLSHTGTDLDGAVNALRDKYRTGCTTYTNFAASNKERIRRGIRSSQSLKRKASIVTS